MSYGMYLAHIIVLDEVHARVAPLIVNAFLRISTIALTTFVITYLAVKLISLLPGSKSSSAKASEHRMRGLIVR
jgi:hypothetical protein